MAADPTRAREAFRSLHESGCFVIPNPWDAGSARALASLGFKALATTSAGFGFSRGLPDVPGELGLDAVLAHIDEIVRATDLPVSADFQNGYASDPERLAANVTRCVETGVAGLSIEDAPGEGGQALLGLPAAVERLRAARAAIDASGADVLLTARAECFLTGHPEPLREALRRLEAYAEAGADVLFAPGVHTREDIGEIVAAATPLPVNVLVSSDAGLPVGELAALGVRRISVGSALSRVAWGAFLRASEVLARGGSFAGVAEAAPFAQLNEMFSRRES